jgi:hypothetical protein
MLLRFGYASEAAYAGPLPMPAGLMIARLVHRTAG